MATPEKEHPAAAVLERAHSPTTASSIFREKIKNRPLLLRPSSPDPKDNAREARRKARQQKAAVRRKSKKPRPLSAKQKRALCIYEIPADQRKYSIYEPLYQMWCKYIRDILNLEKTAHVMPMSAGPMLASADYHGALVEVVRSRCVGRVGTKGIVLKDTKFTFEVINSRNEFKTVPKEHTIFRFKVPLAVEADASLGETTVARSLTFELHGSQFQNRAPDRANKKFRPHFDADI
ncbi:hypothetical protein BT93_L5319 [Corymbia citriodora subsp. variegata]|uniref:Ribonuclease P protein subunit p29 n=1 Tax=Corymbia citriodora subsp. variegata TaxID=360336 RepID=A0A8T0CF91_CORYI|nr:hypothetical protein BT93_L5319 [Corymbia citriodora subsp. variegata]